MHSISILWALAGLPESPRLHLDSPSTKLSCKDKKKIDVVDSMGHNLKCVIQQQLYLPCRLQTLAVIHDRRKQRTYAGIKGSFDLTSLLYLDARRVCDVARISFELVPL